MLALILSETQQHRADHKCESAQTTKLFCCVVALNTGVSFKSAEFGLEFCNYVDMFYGLHQLMHMICSVLLYLCTRAQGVCVCVCVCCTDSRLFIDINNALITLEESLFTLNHLEPLQLTFLTQITWKLLESGSDDCIYS